MEETTDPLISHPSWQAETEQSCGERDSPERGELKFVPYVPNTKRSYNPTACRLLEEAFLITPTPARQRKAELAEELKTTLQQVDTWFQNRRAKQSQRIRSLRQADTPSGTLAPLETTEGPDPLDADTVQQHPWLRTLLN